ncbi:MAG TPA: PGF-CTERM sorting domain-containing protein [Methanosarcinaceae archaeon]|nr:PGF-CTERM sorting domain-containing protein [Methanosarcinaceae archaeon]
MPYQTVKGVPGFEAVIAVMGLLVAAFLYLSQEGMRKVL